MMWGTRSRDRTGLCIFKSTLLVAPTDWFIRLHRFGASSTPPTADDNDMESSLIQDDAMPMNLQDTPHDNWWPQIIETSWLCSCEACSFQSFFVSSHHCFSNLLNPQALQTSNNFRRDEMRSRIPKSSHWTENFLFIFDWNNHQLVDFFLIPSSGFLGLLPALGPNVQRNWKQCSPMMCFGYMLVGPSCICKKNGKHFCNLSLSFKH